MLHNLERVDHERDPAEAPGDGQQEASRENCSFQMHPAITLQKLSIRLNTINYLSPKYFNRVSRQLYNVIQISEHFFVLILSSCDSYYILTVPLDKKYIG